MRVVYFAEMAAQCLSYQLNEDEGTSLSCMYILKRCRFMNFKQLLAELYMFTAYNAGLPLNNVSEKVRKQLSDANNYNNNMKVNVKQCRP